MLSDEGEAATWFGTFLRGLGDDAASARDAAYAAADMIEFEGRQLRRDIALRAVTAEAHS